MRITVIAVGTRGDVQPLTALAAGLGRAGHDVQVATNSEFAALVQEQGLAYCPLSGSPTEMMNSPELAAAMGGNRDPITMVRGILSQVKPLFVGAMREMVAISAGSDLMVVSMLGALAGFSVAEKLGIPCLEAYVLPGRPTRAFPSPLMGIDPHLGGFVNKLSHQLILGAAWFMFSPIVNPARREALGLPTRALRQQFRAVDRDRQPILYGYSSLVLPKPGDWPDHHHVTGYWFLDRPQTWTPPDDLRAFLDAGSPPVYMGFGSMTGRDPERITRIVLAALRMTGQRGILMTGWGGLHPDDVPDSVYVLDSVPHDWLFPHMAAVVHHGGSGTTSAGLRAGVPTIIVPFGGDQFLWGRCIHQLGVGPQPIIHQQLNANGLANAIHAAVHDRAIRERAADLGARIRAEDGIGRAVAVIERFAS